MNIETREDFVHIINENDYKIAAEIGLDKGLNASYLLDNTNLKKLYCFELWATKHSKKHKNKTIEKMLEYGDRFVLVQGPSYKEGMFFADNFFDYVYIDGDHSYRGVLRDLRTFWPKVKEGGFIGGHDYCVAKGCGVIRAVTEFSRDHGDLEFKIIGEEKDVRPSFYMIKGS